MARAYGMNWERTRSSHKYRGPAGTRTQTLGGTASILPRGALRLKGGGSIPPKKGQTRPC